MSSITKVSIDVLRVHPRNQEFFDDISGEDYEQFKNSIKEDGIISEIIVAPDMTILSGHQRVKAAKELGFNTVPIRIREDVETEEQKLKILIAANFGRKINDKAKQRKAIVEYVALCGYSHGEMGRGREKRVQNGLSNNLTLKEIAAQLGTTEGSLKRSLRIERNLSEEMKQLLDDGVITETFAADVIASMSEEEQLELISKLDATKKYTAKELEKVIQENSQLKEQIANLPSSATQREKFEKNRADRLMQENEKLKEQLNKSATEVAPTDYDELKRRDKAHKADYSALEKDRDEKIKIINDLSARLKDLETRKDIDELQKKLETEAGYFTIRTYEYIQKNGGNVWITEKLHELPEKQKKEFINAVYAIDAFAKIMVENIGGYGIG